MSGESGLRVKVSVDAQQASSQINGLKADVEGFKKAFAGTDLGFGKMLEAIGPIGAAFATLAVAAGAAIKAVQGVTEVLHGVDRLGKLAQEAGVATEVFSKLAFATKFSDVSGDELAQTFRHLAGRISDATAGGKEAVAIFQRLRVAFENVDGSSRSTADVFRDVVASFRNLSDVDKVSVAVDLFGRSGQRLIPIINEGTEGLDEWARKAEEAGAVISGDFASRADEFGDSLQLLKEQFRGIALAFTAEVVPALNAVFREIQSVLSQIGAFSTLRDVASELARVMIYLGEVSIASFKSIKEVVSAVTGSLRSEFQLWTTLAQTTVKTLADVFKAQWDFYGEAISLGPVKAFENMGAALKKAMSSGVEGGLNALTARKDDFLSTWGRVATEVTSTWNNAFARMMSPFTFGGSRSAQSSQQKDNPVLNFTPKLDKDTSEILNKINDEYAAATMSKLQLLDYELAQRKQKLREQLKDDEEYQVASATLDLTYANRRQAILDDQRRSIADASLAALRGKAQGITADPDQTQAAKKAQLLPLLQEETNLLANQLEIYKARSQDAGLTDELRIEASRRVNELETERVRILQQIRDLEADTFGGTFRRGMVEMFNEMGNVTRNLASGALRGIRSALDGVTDGIMGAIDGTRTWGEVSAQVLKGMLADLIRIGIQALFVKAITAAFPGFGSFLGIGARATGGIATRGIYMLGEDGPEHVINAPALARYGPQFFDDINAGRNPVPPPSLQQQSSPSRVAVAIVDRRRDADDWINNNGFDRAVVQVIQRTR